LQQLGNTWAEIGTILHRSEKSVSDYWISTLQDYAELVDLVHEFPLESFLQAEVNVRKFGNKKEVKLVETRKKSANSSVAEFNKVQAMYSENEF